MEDKIIEVLEKYEVSNWDMQQMTIELLNLLDVSYSVFDHVTIERIRNSFSDAEVRRMIKEKIRKL
jgi:hypothetical protein